MSNPTLINGFEDIVNFIKQQEHRNQKLMEENKKLKKENQDLQDTKSMYGGEIVELREDIEELKEEAEQNKQLFDTTFGDLMKLKEENKKLKEEVDDLKGRLEDVNHTAEEWEDSYNQLKQESEESYNEVKQELEKTKKYAIDTPGIFHCGVTGRTLTEDDIYLSVEHGRLICEAALEDEQQKKEKELIPVNRKILIQDYIIKNMLYKFLCDGEEAEIEIPKKWRVDGVDSFTLEYSDIMEKVCKEMDEDDWNDDGSNLTLDWHNDTLEVVLHDESE